PVPCVALPWPTITNCWAPVVVASLPLSGRKDLLPLPKHEHGPQVGGTIRDPCLMFAPRLAQIPRVENAIIGPEDNVMRHVLKFATEPTGKWYRESLLGPIEDRVRQPAVHCLLQDVFALTTTQLERRRNLRHGFHQMMIEQRRPDLQ